MIERVIIVSCCRSKSARYEQTVACSTTPLACALFAQPREGADGAHNSFFDEFRHAEASYLQRSRRLVHDHMECLSETMYILSPDEVCTTFGGGVMPCFEGRSGAVSLSHRQRKLSSLQARHRAQRAAFHWSAARHRHGQVGGLCGHVSHHCRGCGEETHTSISNAIRGRVALVLSLTCC